MSEPVLTMTPRRRSRVRILGNLHLQRLQAFALRPIARPHHLPGLVVHAEHQPAAAGTAQIGLVRQRGEVLADVIGAEVATGLLELHHLVFPRGDQALQQNAQALGHFFGAGRHAASGAGNSCCIRPCLWVLRAMSWLDSAAIWASREERQSAMRCCSGSFGRENFSLRIACPTIWG